MTDHTTVARPDAPKRWRPRIAPWSMAIALVIVVVDQVTKHWALDALADNREVEVFWTLQWNLSFNTGMAFSTGEGLGPVIALLAMLVVIVLVVSSAHVESKLARFAAGMLIGGAAGNLIDRLFRGDGWLHGAVIDFIDFQWFPIFNVADIGVTVGATLFAIATLFEGRRAGALVPAPAGVRAGDGVGGDAGEEADGAAGDGTGLGADDGAGDDAQPIGDREETS